MSVGLPRHLMNRDTLLAAGLLGVAATMAGCAEVTTNRAQSIAVLTALYRATDGPDWIRSEGWLTDAPLENWYGVGTDESGRVTSLYLVRNGLAGEIPVELSSLASLRFLDLSHNKLTGEIPPELGNLASLEQLHLERNSLTGTIPSELGDLVNLTWLHLDRNELIGKIPAALGNLTSLQKLDLSENDLTGEIPTELGSLASLQSLYLFGNYLTGEIPTELGNLANLTSMLWGKNAGLCAPTTAQFANLQTTVGPYCRDYGWPRLSR